MSLKHTVSAFHKHAHRRIQTRLILFAIIALIMFGVVIYDVLTQGISLWWIALGAVIGIASGYGIAWAYRFQWSEQTEQVIQNTDRLSILLIALYVVLRIGSKDLLGDFVHGQTLIAVLYSTIAGLMVGRVAGVFHRVHRVLRSRKIL